MSSDFLNENDNRFIHSLFQTNDAWPELRYSVRKIQEQPEENSPSVVGSAAHALKRGSGRTNRVEPYFLDLRLYWAHVGLTKMSAREDCIR